MLRDEPYTNAGHEQNDGEACPKGIEVFFHIFLVLNILVIQSEAKNLGSIHVYVIEILHYTSFRSE